ncbi:hypothetical protein KGQ34_00505 [Patescibacteria group bacterium]|nr:hypothetical protein [Patescibacteria group bacterium]
MSLESLSKQEKTPEENMKEIADEALVGIEKAREDWTEDPNGLPLTADFSYQKIQKQLETHAQPYGEALFRMARSAAGKERLRYADGFSHFLAILKKETAEKVLESLLTNRETAKELQRKAREELEDLPRKPKNFFSGWWKND